MTTAETAWANEKEWAAERGEIEIKIEIEPPVHDAECCATKCDEKSIVEITVGRVQDHYGLTLGFCENHRGDWAEWYGYYGNQES